MDMKKYGLTPNMIPENTKGIPAKVTAVHKERFELVCEHGEVSGVLKSKEYYYDNEEFPTVGDFVMMDYVPNGDCRITVTLPRKSFCSRRNPTPGMSAQAVAANFDYVFIMQSLNHDFNERRLERYLTLAWQSGAFPVVVLTKADLSEDNSEYIRAAERIAPGVPVYAVSSSTGYGLDALSEFVKPEKTLVFLGSSGVGKSSLVNALAGEEIMAVNTIREDDSKGRHTTTHRQLIMLKNGAMIIDTPGMRELGMWEASNGLTETFSDVEQYIGKCRFRDCTHHSEPGCAVKAAIESGELSPERFRSYENLKKEAAYSADSEDYLRHKQEWHKGIAKYQKQRKKEIW